MTAIFYNLEEAAEQLKLSETVLVRLSQYFKVPQLAYETAGYLSFKGDLAFSEQDVAFFLRIKERLVLGDSLDAVKAELQQVPHAQWVPFMTGQYNASDATVIAQKAQDALSPVSSVLGLEPEILGGVSPTLSGELPPMREIQGRQPYEKAAEQSFERYKSMHRSTLGKVFENMLKEVGSPAAGSRPASATPGFRPPHSKLPDAASSPKPAKVVQGEALLPFKRPNRSAHFASSGGMQASDVLGAQTARAPEVSQSTTRESEAVWESIIQQASQTPRSMDIQLKNAALLLRARALSHGAPSKDALR